MKRPEVRLPRETLRQRRTKAYKDGWEEIRKNRRTAPRRRRVLRGPEFVLALERASQATGDPIFADALRAARQYGLDREFERRASRLQVEVFGDPLDGHLAQVAFLVTRGKLEDGKRQPLSVREACECVVAETGLPGASFKAAVERLRKQYLAHPRPDDSQVLNLEAAMTSLLARRIVEQEFLGKKPRKK